MKSDSTVSVVIRLRAGQPGNRCSGLSSLEAADRIPAFVSPKVKGPGYKPDHLPPSSAEVKDTWSCTSRACRVINHKDNFAF
jgi:hypothetical protein